MGFMNNIKKWVDISDDDYEDEFEIEETATAEKEDDAAKRIAARRSRREAQSAASTSKTSAANASPSTASHGASTVALLRPEQFLDASGIADHLLNKRIVVLNLEAINKEESRRMVDFLSGVVYAQRGTLKKVSQYTFVVAPYDVDMMGEFRGELEENGIFF